MMHTSCDIVRLYSNSERNWSINRYISNKARSLGSFVHHLKLARRRVENLPVSFLYNKRLFLGEVLRISYVPFNEQSRRSLLNVHYLNGYRARDTAEFRYLFHNLFLVRVQWTIKIYIWKLLRIRYCRNP